MLPSSQRNGFDKTNGLPKHLLSAGLETHFRQMPSRIVHMPVHMHFCPLFVHPMSNRCLSFREPSGGFSGQSKESIAIGFTDTFEHRYNPYGCVSTSRYIRYSYDDGVSPCQQLQACSRDSNY